MRLKIGSRLTILFISLWLMGALLLASLAYWQARSMLIDGIKARARSCAAIGALMVNMDDFSRLRAAADSTLPEYGRVVDTLSRVASSEKSIRFVYAVRASGDGKVMFVADGSAVVADRSQLGDIYDEASPFLVQSTRNLREAAVEKTFIVDRWGTLLSAYAPLFDRSGKLEGLFCVDIAIESVMATLFLLLRCIILAALAVTLFMAAASVFMARSLTRPIRACALVTDSFARRDFSCDVPESLLSRSDELGDLGRSCEKMSESLQTLLEAI